MSLKQLGGETIIYGLANILPRLLNFVILVPFLTAVMVSEDYGVVGDLFFWIALLIALLTFRMDTVVFRFASRKEYDARAVFRKAQRFVVGAVLAVVGTGLLLAGNVAEWMSYPDRDVYVVLFLLTVACDCLSAVPLARLRLERRAWFFVFVNLGNVLLLLALVFTLLHFWPEWGTLFGVAYEESYQVVYYMGAIAVAAAFRYLLLLADGLWRYRKRKTDWSSSPNYGKMLAYSAPLTLVAVAGVYNAQSGLAVIKEFFGDDVTSNLYWTGQFSAALKLAVILNLFVTAFNYAAEPFFFRQAGSDLATADRTIYADAARAYAIVGTLVCAGILVFLPWLKDFIGRDLQEGLFVLPFILAGNFFLGLYSNFSIAYKLTDKTYLGGIIAFTGSIICAAVGIGFIGEYGIIAPALAMLACYLTMCVLAWLVTRRVFPVPYPLLRILLYIILSALTVYGALSLDAGLGARIAMFAALIVTYGAVEYKWLRSVLRT
ncbi:lipopolysaccharide biosynthesis protein [Lewinella sp. 4G2]|uniref:lipopolysaccharide biosynthesis protein n=1 Tax=Lewinella sp. 4G2 TaxID=1803372 RepID=UPI0007B4B84B|nr:hypothetical protein [Lewinella sp. 4G2]OAV46223.1 hypothetical protein A3850_018380 [Lewinella sp. 4G2]